LVSKIREKKEAVVSEIKEKLKLAQVAVLTDYRGLTVAEMNELRRKLREANIEYRVIKNTLARLAAKDIGLEGLKDFLEGPTAIAFGTEDPVAPAKIISEYAKDHKALEIKGGVLEGQIVSLEKVKALADLPSKEQLLAQVVSVMQSPIINLVNVLNAPIRDFVMVVDAVRRKREQEAS